MATQGCNCGFWRTGLRECKCSDGDVARYQARISGPLLDRIDLYVDVPSIDVSEFRESGNEESSAVIRARVVAARRRRQLGAATQLTASAERRLAQASRVMALSGRGIARTVGVARTIACLADSAEIDEMHVSEALQYRVPSDHQGLSTLPSPGSRPRAPSTTRHPDCPGGSNRS